MYRKRIVTGLLGLCASLALWACAGGDGGPAQGTPEWYWQAALESYEAGDYSRTLENLDSIVDAGDSPVLAKAHVWRMTLLSGLTRGYGGVWKAFDSGAEANAALARSLQNPLQESQRQLRRYAIALTESIGKTNKALGSADKVVIDFPFPAGSAAMSPVLASISGGTVTPDNQVPMAQKAELDRGLIFAAAHVIGEGDAANSAKTRFEQLPIEVDRETFFFRLTEGMKSTADMFVRRHIDEPKVREAMMGFVKRSAGATAELENEELATAAKELLGQIEEEEKQEARRR